MATATIEEKLLSKQNSRNIIRAKLVELGLAESTAKLDQLADIIAGIVNRGAVSVQIKEGQTYTIPEGWHNGGGTVSGVAGGGEYTLEPTKTVTPTKSQQSIGPADGFYGLEGVIVNAIPAIYQDVSGVTAAAGDVLTGKLIVLADGTLKAGTMPDIGAVNKVLDATTITYTIPAGKHSGSGKVSIELETKTATPTKSTQNITPSAGKVLSKVTIDPIPEKYVDNSSTTSNDANVLSGVKYGAPGEIRTGSMTNNGTVSGSVDGITILSVDIPKGYTDGGKIEFDDAKIVEMLDAI